MTGDIESGVPIEAAPLFSSHMPISMVPPASADEDGCFVIATTFEPPTSTGPARSMAA